MEQQTKIQLEQFKNQFKNYEKYITDNDWTKDHYLTEESFNTEASLVDSVIKNLERFIKENEEDLHLKEIRNFFKESLKLIDKHTKRIELYLEVNDWAQTFKDEKSTIIEELANLKSTTEPIKGLKEEIQRLEKLLKDLEKDKREEINFQKTLFDQKTKASVSLSKLNITDEDNKKSLNDLLYAKKKAPLLMKNFLCKHLPVVEERTKGLEINWESPNPATSKEMFINMKPKDIPPYNPNKHYFEQPISTIQFWQEEINKIKNGININGFHLSPWLYWHSNFFFVSQGKEENKKTKVARLRDNEYFFDHMWRKARHLKKEGLLVYGSRRIGKELANYTPLITPNGQTPIGDIKTGDIVYGRDGKKTKVTDVFPQGKKPIYRLHFLDGRTIDAGLEHQFTFETMENKNKEVTRTVGEILKGKIKYKHNKSGYNYKYYLPQPKPVEFDTKELKIHPYLMGILLGDGSIRQGTPNFSTIDEEIVDYIKEILGKDYEITVDQGEIGRVGYIVKRNIKYVGEDKYSNSEYENFKCGINSIRREIDRIGINKNCYNKFIPDLYKYSDVEQRFELLRGLLDSDGSVNNDGSIEFSVNNEILANDVLWLVRSLGIRAQLGHEPKKMITKKMPPHGTIRTFETEKWRVYIRTDLPVFKLKRKLERVKKRENRSSVALDRIEYIGDFDATCIAVDNEEHLYLAEDFVVTHNSVIMASHTIHKLITIEDAKGQLVATNSEDLRNLKGYMTTAVEYLPDALGLAINVNSEKEFKIGVKKTAQNHLDYAILNILNLDSGKGTGTQKTAGGTPDVVVFDEIGKNAILESYEALRPALENGGRTTALLAGTGNGNEDMSKDAEQMLRNYEIYGILPMDWDFLEEMADPECFTWKRTNFSMFVPAQLNLNVDKEESNLANFLHKDDPELEKIPMDITNWKLATENVYETRKLKATDHKALTSEVIFHPIETDEVFMSSKVNPFDGIGIKNHKQELIQKEKTGTKVRFYKDENNTIQFKITNDPTVDIYPFRGGNLDAPTVLYEILDANNPPPFGMYVIGLDDIKHDKSSGDSVLSATVYKRGVELDEWADRIVCSYDTRPEKKDIAYRNLYMIMKYYNAIVFPENEDNGFVDFLERNYPNDAFKHLANSVDFANSMGFENNRNRRVGYTPTGKNNRHLNNRVLAYTREDIDAKEGEETKRDGYTRISHIMLLEEMINYKEGANADRLRSFGMALIYAEYLDKNHMFISRRKFNTQEDDTPKKKVVMNRGFTTSKRKKRW